MNDLERLEQELRSMHLTASARIDERIQRDAGRALGRQRRAPVHLTARRVAGVAAAAAIAALVLVLAVTSLLRPSSVYAQAVEQLEKAQRIHLRSEHWNNGQWVKDQEGWYDARLGLRFERPDETIIEDGTYQWSYRPEEGQVVRRRIQVMTHQMQEYFREGLLRELKKAKLDPSGDRSIDGVACRLYVSSGPIIVGVDAEKKQPVYSTERSRYWIDEDRKLRLFEMDVQRQDRWEPRTRTVLSYETELDASLLSPDFGSDVKVVKQDELTDQLLEQRYNPEQALARVEDLGLIYYLHKVLRCDDGRILLVGSVRPTEKTRRQFPYLWPDKSWESYGDFQVGGRLATATSPAEGVFFDWSLWKRAYLVREGKLRVHVSINPNEKLAAQTKDVYAGKLLFSADLTVPLPGNVVPLAEALDLLARDLADFGAAGFFLEPFHARFLEDRPFDDKDWQVAPTREELERHLNDQAARWGGPYPTEK